MAELSDILPGFNTPILHHLLNVLYDLSHSSCMSAHVCTRCTLCIKLFSLFQDAQTFILPLLAIFRKHILSLSPFLLVLHSFKPLGVYLLLLYTVVIFPSVSVCLIEAEFVLLGSVSLGPRKYWGSSPACFSS